MIQIQKIYSFFKKRKCARKTLIVFLTLSNMNKLSDRVATHTYKIDVFFYKSDMHVRPLRFSILGTPNDSSCKTHVFCYNKSY